MLHTRKEQMEAFGRFLDILDELREKCPWDRKQTNESLRPNTIEETYELCDALIRDDKNDICKELGDVLLHVAFYAKIGSETDDFDMKDVCDRLCEKLIFRHPHVFGDVKAETAGQVSENWEQLKLKEKDGNKTVLSGVPAALPSLIKAYRIRVAVVFPGKVATTLLFVGFAGLLLNWPLLGGLGVCDASWLPGFNADSVSWGIWFVYAGLVLALATTMYYVSVALAKVRAARREGEEG